MAKHELSILLVDDDLDDTTIFEETIKSINTTIFFQSAIDGQVALNWLSKTTIYPDVIFLDLNMPRLNGKEFLKQIKANSDWKVIPVIMYTTSSHSKDIEEAMMAGAIGFITKPTSLDELQIILSTVVESLPHNLYKAVRELTIGNH